MKKNKIVAPGHPTLTNRKFKKVAKKATHATPAVYDNIKNQFINRLNENKEA